MHNELLDKHLLLLVIRLHQHLDPVNILLAIDQRLLLALLLKGLELMLEGLNLLVRAHRSLDGLLGLVWGGGLAHLA